MSSEKELYHCRAGHTAQNVISKDKHGEFKIDLVWRDQTKGKLRVYRDRLVFKNAFLKPIEMPYRQMRGVLLLSTKIALVRCHILWIVQEQGDCGFSMLRNDFWEGRLPFRCHRADANASHTSILKEFSKGLVTGGIGEIAGGLVGGSSLAGNVASELTSTVTSKVADGTLDKAGEQVRRIRNRNAPVKPTPKRQTASPPPSAPASAIKASNPPLFPVGAVDPNHRYVIRRGMEESAGINKATLVRIVQSGKLVASDEVWDLSKRQKLSSKKLIEKFA